MMEFPSLANEDAVYVNSSQFRIWNMSRVNLAARRHENNMVARQQISSRLKQIWDYENKPHSERKLPQFLTPEDELKLVTFSTNELLRAGAYLELPLEVLATGAVLFRRFYVTNSVMTYAPTQILKTALFFAAKIELGFRVSAKKFETLPKTTVEDVVAGEYVLAMSNEFSYEVKHPFRALEGIALELRRMGLEGRQISKAREQARAILKFSGLMTDVYFHYTPSQITLAALSIADKQLALALVEIMLSGDESDDITDDLENPVRAEMRDQLMSTLEDCKNMLLQEPPGRGEYWIKGDGFDEVKPIRRMLKWCRDPDRWDLVKLQKVRRGKKATASDEKTRLLNSNPANDPFGPAL